MSRVLRFCNEGLCSKSHHHYQQRLHGFPESNGYVFVLEFAWKAWNARDGLGLILYDGESSLVPAPAYRPSKRSGPDARTHRSLTDLEFATIQRKNAQWLARVLLEANFKRAFKAMPPDRGQAKR